MARHYASGDIFLFPSKTDTFGNVVTEAMASGLAVVSYDDAAASEHIRQEENGMKAALDDDSGFIDNALKLADQPTLLDSLAGSTSASSPFVRPSTDHCGSGPSMAISSLSAGWVMAGCGTPSFLPCRC